MVGREDATRRYKHSVERLINDTNVRLLSDGGRRRASATINSSSTVLRTSDGGWIEQLEKAMATVLVVSSDRFV
jgi:hypothetical protein